MIVAAKVIRQQESEPRPGQLRLRTGALAPHRPQTSRTAVYRGEQGGENPDSHAFSEFRWATLHGGLQSTLLRCRQGVIEHSTEFFEPDLFGGGLTDRAGTRSP